MVKKKVKIREEFCKECGLCVAICPDKALSFLKTYNSKGYHSVVWNGACKLCGLCYMVCPDLAIEVVVNEEIVER